MTAALQPVWFGRMFNDAVFADPTTDEVVIHPEDVEGLNAWMEWMPTKMIWAEIEVAGDAVVGRIHRPVPRLFSLPTRVTRMAEIGNPVIRRTM